jgi:dipeptidyl aminopeptidase/acylaminoacyl peptidase
LQPEVALQLYPKPGDAIDLEQPVLFHVDARERFEIANELFPLPYLLRNPGWRRDSRSFAFEYTERGHRHMSLLEVDARSGEVRAAITESSETFIDLYRGYRHDVDGLGAEVIWISERDGWRHLYLFDGLTGKVKNRITEGRWVVRSVLEVDDEERRIWFAASGMNPDEDPYFVHYYRVNFDGSGLTQLTAAGASHDVVLSPDRGYFLDLYSRVDMPPVAELRLTDSGALVRTLATADISRLAAAGFQPPEPFVAKGRDGETDIWGLIYRPRDLDPAGQYPVIELIYAGPQDSYVQKTFWPFGSAGRRGKGVDMQALADLGFIVVQMDGMGTANRSKAFHDVAWKNLQDAGFPDRIRWHQAAAAVYPWYDLSRGVGIYGGSAGGQNALNALLFHPEFYSAAVGWAGCYDNRMDKIWWSEQWLGWPLDESYLRSSGVENAGRLRGRFLLAYGEQDSNVDPATSLQLVNALIKAGKDFDMLVFPGVDHGFGRSDELAHYYERKKYDFFVENLMLGQRTPDWNETDSP